MQNFYLSTNENDYHVDELFCGHVLLWIINVRLRRINFLFHRLVSVLETNNKKVVNASVLIWFIHSLKMAF
jgi:hypothetical protein